MTPAQIADNEHRKDVKKFLKSMPTTRELTKEFVKEQIEKGKTDAEIAFGTYFAPSDIYYFRKKNKIANPNNKAGCQPKFDIPMDKLKDQIAKGLNNKQLGEAFGCSSQVIANRLAAYKLVNPNAGNKVKS
jgi:hypothetical protein